MHFILNLTIMMIKRIWFRMKSIRLKEDPQDLSKGTIDDSSSLICEVQQDLQPVVWINMSFGQE